MPFSLQQLDLSAPTLLVELSDPLDPAREGPNMNRDMNDHLGQIEGDRVYLIMDMTNFKMKFGTLVAGLGAALRPTEGVDTSNIDADRVNVLVVGNSRLVTLLINSAKQEQYGSRHIQGFKTRNEALAHISQA